MRRLSAANLGGPPQADVVGRGGRVKRQSRGQPSPLPYRRHTRGIRWVWIRIAQPLGSASAQPGGFGERASPFDLARPPFHSLIVCRECTDLGQCPARGISTATARSCFTDFAVVGCWGGSCGGHFLSELSSQRAHLEQRLLCRKHEMLSGNSINGPGCELAGLVNL